MLCLANARPDNLRACQGLPLQIMSSDPHNEPGFNMVGQAS